MDSSHRQTIVELLEGITQANSARGGKIEVELKSPMNNHSAIRLIKELAISASIIQSKIITGQESQRTVTHDPQGEYRFFKIFSYQGPGSDRVRTIRKMTTPTDLYPDGLGDPVREEDHKTRVADIIYNEEGHKFTPLGKTNIKFPKISISLEPKFEGIKSNNSYLREIVRYDISQGLIPFLGLKCTGSIITIERSIIGSISNTEWLVDSANPYIVEMEWNGEDPITDFVDDISLLYQYNINYQPMTRPQDLNRRDITHSTFFARGPHRVTVKNNGFRRFIFFQERYLLAIQGGTEELSVPVSHQQPRLAEVILDVEVINDGQLVILDVWHPSMTTFLSHEQRIEWFRDIDIPQVGFLINNQRSAYIFIFKEFLTLSANNWDQNITNTWNQVEQDKNDRYDGIILLPNYRPFYSPYYTNTVPQPYKFKPYQSIDTTPSGIRYLEDRPYQGRRYSIQVSNNKEIDTQVRALTKQRGELKNRGKKVNREVVVEYKISNIISNEAQVIVTLDPIRVRPDRANGNQPNVIHKILNNVMENLTIDDLLGTQLDASVIPLPPHGIFEVIEDRGIPIVSGKPANPRVILFPDHNYPWPEGATVIVVIESRFRLGDYSDEPLSHLPVPIEAVQLIPDSVAVNRKYLNSIWVLKIKFEMTARRTGNDFTITYQIPHNYLSQLLDEAANNAKPQEGDALMKIASNIGIVSNTTPIEIAQDRSLEPTYGPMWWAPSHGYPCLLTAYNFIIRSILMGKGDSDLIANMVSYLSPLGMTKFMTLSDADMNTFFDQIESDYGVYGVGQFIIPFLVMMRLHLNTEIYTGYKKLNISSNLFSDNDDVTLDRYYSRGDSHDHPFDTMDLLKSNSNVLCQLPALFFLKDSGNADYQKKLSTYIRYLNTKVLDVAKTKNQPTTFEVYSNNNAYVIVPTIIHTDKNNDAEDISGLMAELVLYAYASLRDREKIKRVKGFYDQGIVRTYLPEELYGGDLFQVERPYVSINWTSKNPAARVNENIANLIRDYYSTSRSSKSRIGGGRSRE